MKHVVTILGSIALLTGVTPAIYAQTNLPTTPKKGENIYQQAEDKLKSGDYLGAVAAYNQVLQLDNNDADAYVNRGIARFQLGDKRGAIEDFTQAIHINPANAAAYNQRGGVYLIMGDKHKAKADFQQATKILNGQGNTSDSQQPPNPDAPPAPQ
ncbi:MAG: tetratricopeptide repeat protein [Chroococcidiopsidaceae cyanobacterium CP_BM_ER_R8_30]|nr:tetratricopeptide repeat protein [Chroococcidiopsidaceae cyanobacterium CP_BM_ER_R8_30]